MQAKSEYEYEFDPDEPNNTAATIHRLAVGRGGRVLDLGSGPGIVAGRLASINGLDVTCADAEQRFLDRAIDRGVSETVQVDLDDPSWHDKIVGEFDVVLLADVLEHLRDPESVLRAIRNRPVISDDGRLVVSIPNAGYVGVVAELIAGRFTYSETGLLDSTHIRFFTETSFRDMASRAGFVVGEVHRITRPISDTEFFARMAVVDGPTMDRIRERHESFEAYQLVFLLHPSTAAGQIDALSRSNDDLNERILLTDLRLKGAREEIERVHAEHSAAVRHRDEARAEVAELSQLVERYTDEAEAAGRQLVVERGRVDELNSDVRRLEQVMGRERATLRAERNENSKRVLEAGAKVEEAESCLGDMRQQLAAAQHEAALLNIVIADIHASGTWRAGSLVRRMASPVVAPAKLVRNRIRQGKGAVPLPVPAPEASVPEVSGGSGHCAPAVDQVHPEDLDARARYESATRVRNFAGVHSGRRVSILVWTLDFDEGRGDVYVAVGLGLRLEELGYEVVYVPRDQWGRLPEGTDLVLAMIHQAEPLAFPVEVQRIAWIRNHTESWIESGRLGLYDAILCSSEATKATVDRHVGEGVITGLLRIGVDTDLFNPGAQSRSGVVSTVNQWGPPRDVLGALADMSPVDFSLVLHGHFVGLPQVLDPHCGAPVSFFALPHLYRGSTVVLDDFNHTTRAFGNVNSRMYEALACGAMVITNTRRGLDEVGLESVPTWSTPPQLRDRIAAALFDPDATTARSAELAEVVASQHGWSVRAREFDEFVSRLDGERVRSTIVGFFPDYRATNPYQGLLYGGLAPDIIAVPVRDVFSIGEAAMSTQRELPFVFHLHWTAPILGSTDDEDEARARKNQFMNVLDRSIGDGASFVWTIHNEMPHECRHPALEHQLRQELVDRADLIHVMGESGLARLRGQLELPLERTVVIPHPSYLGHYPDLVTSASARRDLEIGQDEHVILFLGEARDYKGLPTLLEAFIEARVEAPELRLLVVTPADLAEPGLICRLDETDGVTLIPRRVRDDQLQVPMRAADVVALPYSRSLNSGALLLALSFARPVIVAGDHPPAELVGHDIAERFPAGDVSGLAHAILASRRLRSDGARSAARAVAEEFAPDVVAEKFRAAIVGIRGSKN